MTGPSASMSQHASTDAGTGTTHNHLICALPQVEQRQLLVRSDEVRLMAGQILALPDEPIRFIYFPLDAVVSLLVSMQDGSAIEGAAIGSQGVIGLSAFFGQPVESHELAVQIPGAALRVPVSTFLEFVGQSACLRNVLRRYTLALLNHLGRTAGCNRVHSVRQRCARWLLMGGDLLAADSYALTHEALANVLGTRRASVTEAAESLKDAGLIDYHRGRMTILDTARLQAAACEDYGLIKRGYEQIAAMDGAQQWR